MSGPAIAIVSRRFWPLVGETEWVAANVASEFQKRGHSVGILTSRMFPQWPANFQFRSCQVTRLPQKFPAFRSRRLFERSCVKFLREHGQNLKAVLLFPCQASDLECAKLIVQLGHRCIMRLDDMFLKTAIGGSLSFSPQHQKSLLDLEEVCKNPGGNGQLQIVVPNQRLQSFLESISIPSTVIADGVNKVEWHDGTPELAQESTHRQLLARQGLTRSHPLLRIRTLQKLAVSVGPLDSDQCLDRWIGCWPQVLQKIPKAALWIIGEGRYQQQLWDQIIDLGLDERIVLGGVFDDLTEVYRAADLFLLGNPDRCKAPFVLQAQHCGLPILADLGEQDHQSATELEHISVCTAPSLGDLSQHICDLFSGKMDVQKSLESARNQIEKFHTIEACVNKYSELT